MVFSFSHSNRADLEKCTCPTITEHFKQFALPFHCNEISTRQSYFTVEAAAAEERVWHPAAFRNP